MILLTATRTDAFGGFIFRIEVSGIPRLVTGNAQHAALILHEMGVSQPESLVKQAQERGEVEIATDLTDPPLL